MRRYTVVTEKSDSHLLPSVRPTGRPPGLPVAFTGQRWGGGRYPV